MARGAESLGAAVRSNFDFSEIGSILRNSWAGIGSIQPIPALGGFVEIL